jgi:hypothetical protein
MQPHLKAFPLKALSVPAVTILTAGHFTFGGARGRPPMVEVIIRAMTCHGEGTAPGGEVTHRLGWWRGTKCESRERLMRRASVRVPQPVADRTFGGDSPVKINFPWLRRCQGVSSRFGAASRSE